MGKQHCKAVAGALALALIVGGAGTVFAGAESEAGTTAPEVVELEWVGLGLSAGGGRLYPDPGCVACVALEEAVSALEPQVPVKLIPIETHFQSQDEMNLLFASGVIPDHWMVQQNHFPRQFEQGLMRDIPEDVLRPVRTQPGRVHGDLPAVLEAVAHLRRRQAVRRA